MTKDDVLNTFGSYSNAAKIATEHGKAISPQGIRQWPDGNIDVLWAAFFYLIQQKRQLTLDMVFSDKEVTE